MFENFSTTECCNCGIKFGVPKAWLDTRRTDMKTFWCPNGHQLSFGESLLDKVRLERDRLKQQLAQKDDEIKRQRDRRNDAEKRVIAYKGVVTKTKKRLAGGVCPCCNRTFENLHRHMATKHADYQKQEEVA